MKRIIFLTFFALTISKGFACPESSNRPGPTRDINFDFNSSAISNSEILSLANWIVDTRETLSTLEGVSIIGLADEHERNPERMAEDRAKNVKQALNVLGVRSGTTGVIAHIYKPTRPSDKYEPTGTRAEITLIPGCAKD